MAKRRHYFRSVCLPLNNSAPNQFNNKTDHKSNKTGHYRTFTVSVLNCPVAGRIAWQDRLSNAMGASHVEAQACENAR